MAELNGYLLTKEEEQACLDLLKKMRTRTPFDADFTGEVKIRARSEEEATLTFWEWVSAIQDMTLDKWAGQISLPKFELDFMLDEW